MAKRILVTGAAGFIGSHVAQRLLERGDRVVALDNLNDYYDPKVKRRNIEEVRAAVPDGELDFIEGDIRDGGLIDQIFAAGIDGIVNLAAMAGVRVSLEDPALYYDVNLNGTLILLEAARRAEEPPNFVQASTSSVYGATEEIPFIETDHCDRPLAPYPASKRAAEMLGFTFHHIYGLDFTALRFFTVYGPRGRPDMMAYMVADSIRSGREVHVYNDGQMHRDWTFVNDIVSGVVAAVDRRLGYEIVNLGRGEPVLLADFIRHIEELLGQSANLISAPMPAADISYTSADISKAGRLLDYAPQTSFRDGIEAFLEWYETQS